MDYISLIRKPIDSELADFNTLFDETLTHTDGLLSQALAHIRQKTGKRMRPMLILLMARLHGDVTRATLDAAVGLELLHTASLVHDDVVDESGERRGQASLNAVYDNKVAVLVGDYLLSTALLCVARTGNTTIVDYLAHLGQALASGEILQLSNIGSDNLSEEVYYSVIRQKTAALFEACCSIGALSAGAGEAEIEAARQFGQQLGVAFQIRDDIFDYYPSPEIGKPTGNDMAEGKLTLPAIHAINSTGNEEMRGVARRVKDGTVSPDEIARLVEFTKENGGIDYAWEQMERIAATCQAYIDAYAPGGDIATALHAYVDFVIRREN